MIIQVRTSVDILGSVRSSSSSFSRNKIGLLVAKVHLNDNLKVRTNMDILSSVVVRTSLDILGLFEFIFFLEEQSCSVVRTSLDILGFVCSSSSFFSRVEIKVINN